MKKWILLLSVLCLTACGSKGGDNNQAPAPATPPTATTPLDTACLQNTVYCNNSTYNQQGWTSYPNAYYQSYQGYYKFCSCPVGTMPAYNGTIGLGCVRTTYVPQMYFHVRIRWHYGDRRYVNYGYNGNGANNLGQQSNTQPQPAQTNNCYSNVAQSCFVNQPNTCANGGYCQATSGGSSLGVCITQTSYGPGGR